MSKYSGKCDFGDSWNIFGAEKILSSRIFVGHNIVPLRIDSYKDALPYFPFIVASATGGYIRLSNRSFVDEEEEERLEIALEDAKRFYKRKKRQACECEADDILDHICWGGYNREAYRPIAEAVVDFGTKATVPQRAHIPISDGNRKRLYFDMIAEGYSQRQAAEWCFGWQRVYGNDLPDGVEVPFWSESEGGWAFL